MPPARLLQLLRHGAGTMKFKIVVLAVATGLAASIVSVQVALNTSAAEIEAAVVEREGDDAQRTAALLGDKLDMLQASLAAVKDAAPPALWTSPAGMTRYVLDEPSLMPNFDSVLAADADGQPLVRVRRGHVDALPQNLGDREYFQRAVASDQPVVSRPLIGPLTGVPIIVLAHAALDERGHPLGVLIGTLALRSTGLFSLNARHGGTGMREIVVDRHGVILSHPDPARILAPATGEPGLATAVNGWIDSGAPIDTQAQVRRVDGHFVALAGIPGSDWALIRATEAGTALHAVDRARRNAWASAAIAGVVASLLAGVLAWAMTQPITRLRRCAERLADEPGADVAWPRAGGEVGRLSRSFADLMAGMRRRDDEVRGLLRQLRLVLDHAKVGIALARDGRFELVSAELEAVLGRAAQTLVGASPQSLYPDAAAWETVRDEAAAALMRAGEYEREVELLRGDGRRFWCHLRARAVEKGRAGAGAIWLFEDVTDRRSRHDALAYAAQHDALTGLVNRATFDRALEAACASADERPFVTLFIDLDRFKAVNDTCGHAAGDEVLRNVARRLAEAVRQHDVVARLGGDEFAVLLPDCPPARAQRIADQMLSRIEAFELHRDGRVMSVGASIGVVPSRAGASAAQILAAADAACYAAKRAGRGRVSMATQPVPVRPVAAAAA